MLDSMTYINSSKQKIEFGKGNILIKSNGFRDYAWSYNTAYKKVTTFTKDIREIPLDVLIYGVDARDKAQKMFEMFEKDVLTKTPGTLYIGDYYIKGYFYGIQKQVYLEKDVVKERLMFVTDSDRWTKEVTTTFRLNESQSEDVHGFPYDFPYDYNSNIFVNELYNSSYVPEDMIITLYGECHDPSITINHHEYSLENVDVDSGKKVVINTLKKTVELVDEEGNAQNIFSHRNKDSYIFEKLQTGTNLVSTSNVGVIGITILYKRSEPEWI